MADKPAKPASLLAPTSEETYGSLLEFLNGNVEVHTERGVNFTRAFQSVCQIFRAHVGGKRQQSFSGTELPIHPLRLQSVLKQTSNGQNWP